MFAAPQSSQSQDWEQDKYSTWHPGFVTEQVELRDLETSSNTFPRRYRRRRDRKRQPNAESRIEIAKLKDLYPIKQLKHNVEEYELRDYRAKAQKLTPKGEYFGMKNFHRSLSVASYFSKGILFSYPKLTKSPSLYDLVSEYDANDDEDDVFDNESCLNSARSEPERRTKSDSELMARSKLRSKTTDDIRTVKYRKSLNARSKKLDNKSLNGKPSKFGLQ